MGESRLNSSQRWRVVTRGTFFLCWVILFGGAFFVGCGRDSHPQRFEVNGKITFPDGDPVQTGVVEFIPLNNKKGITANGTIQSDGTYALSSVGVNDGAIPGEYRVVVKQFIFYDKIPKHKHSHGGDVHTRFGDESQTPLKFTVRAEKNVADFEVHYADKK